MTANKAPPEIARIVASKMMRTSAYHRPAPSLFFFPGLESRPFHDASQFSFTKDFEQNLDTIRAEYQALRSAYGERDDYVKSDGEHTLNEGKWQWMNFVEKGQPVNQSLF